MLDLTTDNQIPLMPESCAEHSATTPVRVGVQAISVAALAGEIAAQTERCWLLDYDGTLTPIVSQPEDAIIAPGDLDQLARLSASPSDRVSIISGRSVQQLLSFVGSIAPAPILLVGLHGGEAYGLATGQYLYRPAESMKDRITELKAELSGELTVAGLIARGVRLEDKGFSIALHFRNADPAAGEAAQAAFIAACAPLLSEGFAIRPGKMVLECLPAAFDKGGAAVFVLEWAARELGVQPFAIGMGDDLTDEHLFAALAAHAAGSASVLVSPDPARISAACYRLAAPSEVQAVLGASLAAIGR